MLLPTMAEAISPPAQAFVEGPTGPGALRPLVRAVVAGVLREASFSADVEDCTQEALRRALDHGDSVRDPKAYRAWVLGIARHVALDTIRARRRWRARVPDEKEGEAPAADLLADPGPSPADALEAARRTKAIRQAIDTLPEGPRKALTLFHVEGMSYPVIAERLGVPLGTVATWVTRGRKSVLDVLQQEGWMS